MAKKFAKMYQDASKKGAVINLTPKYLRWEHEGDQIIGAYVGHSAVTSRLGGEPYNQYLFETDEGRVKFSMGRSADNELADTFARGNIYAITYQGKEKIQGGRSVNRFQVEELGVVDDNPDEDDPDREEGEELRTNKAPRSVKSEVKAE